MQKKLFLFLLLGLLLCQLTKAQEIYGYIYDQEFKTGLRDIHVHLIEQHKGVISNENGVFKIKNIEPGQYRLIFSALGYQNVDTLIRVNHQQRLLLDFPLKRSSLSVKEIVVSPPDRTMQESLRSFSSSKEIGAQYTSDRNIRTTPELFYGVNGVWVQKTNHGGGSPFIRGLTGNQNLIVIDGIRLNNAGFRYGPNQYLNSIDPETINSIDILKGSGSVLYGSDALGGVINIVSKSPQFTDDTILWETNINTAYRSDFSTKSTLETINKVFASVSGSKLAINGGFSYNVFGDIVPGDSQAAMDQTGYKEYSYHAKALIKLNKRGHLTFAVQNNRQDDVPRYDKLISGYSQYHFDPQIRSLYYAKYDQYTNSRWFQKISTGVSMHRSDESRRKMKNGSTVMQNEIDIIDSYGFTADIHSKPQRNWSIISGIDIYHDRVNSKAEKVIGQDTIPIRSLYADGSVQNSFSLFSSHSLDIHQFRIKAGIRLNAFDIHGQDSVFSDFGIKPLALTGNLGAAYILGKHNNLNIMFNRAYRAPNVNDLSSFGSFSNGIEVPPGNLNPEIANSFSLGWRTDYKIIKTTLSAYYTLLEDLIIREEADYFGEEYYEGEKVYTKINTGSAFIKGFEAEMQVNPLKNMHIEGFVSYTYGQQNEEAMRRIPPLFGGLKINYSIPGKYGVRLEYLAAAKQDRLSSGDIKDIRIPEGGTPGWNSLNCNIFFNWNIARVVLGIDNIFDEKYKYHGSGVYNYGRNFFVKLSLNFGS